MRSSPLPRCVTREQVGLGWFLGWYREGEAVCVMMREPHTWGLCVVRTHQAPWCVARVLTRTRVIHDLIIMKPCLTCLALH
jgi:hypothetical protein